MNTHDCAACGILYAKSERLSDAAVADTSADVPVFSYVLPLPRALPFPPVSKRPPLHSVSKPQKNEVTVMYVLTLRTSQKPAVEKC